MRLGDLNKIAKKEIQFIEARLEKGKMWNKRRRRKVEPANDKRQ